MDSASFKTSSFTSPVSSSVSILPCKRKGPHLVPTLVKRTKLVSASFKILIALPKDGFDRGLDNDDIFFPLALRCQPPVPSFPIPLSLREPLFCHYNGTSSFFVARFFTLSRELCKRVLHCSVRHSVFASSPLGAIYRRRWELLLPTRSLNLNSMDSRHFSFFSETMFYAFLHRWRLAGRMILRISVGDIFFFVDPELGESALPVAMERTVIRAGSAAWFDAPYEWFRWIYGLMRVHGFQELRWEMLMRAGFSVVLPTVSFIEPLRALYLQLRVSYPRELD